MRGFIWCAKGAWGASGGDGCEGCKVAECCGLGAGSEDGSRVVVLRFMRDALLFDIANMGYVVGDVSDVGHARHVIQDIAAGGNRDLATRVLDVTHASIVELLYPYTQYEIERDRLDDRLVERRVYEIRLRLPKEFSQTSVDLLLHLAHEYLVTMVVYRWLGMVAPGLAGAWLERVAAAEEEIKALKNSARGRIRTRCRPF